MAKTTDFSKKATDHTNDIYMDVRPNTLLKIKGESGSGKRGILCDRIVHLLEKKENKIPPNEMLVLSTSKESLYELETIIENKIVLKNCNIKMMTFSGLIEYLLQKYFHGCKILKKDKIRYIESILGKNVKFSFDKLKVSIQQISSIDHKILQKMSDFELIVRYGLNREACLKLKKCVGNCFYVPYSQLIEEACKFPNFFDDLKKYKFIGVANFHNFSEDEARFLVKMGAGKHITVIGNDKPKAKYVLFEKNWEFISSGYKMGNVTEIVLNGQEINTDEFNSALNEKVINDKLDSANVENLAMVIMKVFSNPKSNLPFLQLMSIIPGFDKKFLKQFCNIVSAENLNFYDFLIKYQGSLSDKTKLKILPILDYMNKIEKKLDKTNANSIMIHLLNFCKILEVKTEENQNMKDQFIKLHMWLKFMENHRELQVSNNLMECYIMNGTFKSKPEYINPSSISYEQQQNDSQQQQKSMNATLNIKLPVSITMETSNINNMASSSSSSGNVKLDDTPLRRSNSTKYKPRPRSWHAGNLLNVARKLK